MVTFHKRTKGIRTHDARRIKGLGQPTVGKFQFAASPGIASFSSWSENRFSPMDTWKGGWKGENPRLENYEIARGFVFPVEALNKRMRPPVFVHGNARV